MAKQNPLSIKGTKVTLRPMTPEEFPLFHQWTTQSEATPFLYGDLYGNKVPTYEELKTDYVAYYFDGSEPEKGRCFMILVKDQPIGQINYNQIDRKNQSVELDIWIAADQYKNKGYGSDALKTLCNYLSDHMDIKRFFIE